MDQELEERLKKTVDRLNELSPNKLKYTSNIRLTEYGEYFVFVHPEEGEEDGSEV